ncbi:MAG TPA: DUF302 domain-containing protein [Usitatibacter sp.]|nr:DUF302 domain-containing protein [Usitatibacter sp.]
MRKALGTAALALVLAASAARAGEPNDNFWVRSSAKSPDEVVTALRNYAEGRKWLYLATFKIKSGEVTSVKICYPPIGKDIFAAGMHVAAMMPCGHIAVYNDGGTKLAMLHPKFMTVLYPDPNLERAVRTVTPLFEAMLDEVAR